MTSEQKGLKLNLGCGQNHMKGYVNVDKYGDPEVRCDLEVFPWPWEDNSVSYVLMNHVLEHLGQGTDVYLGIIKEIYRICEDGAHVQVNVPHPRHDDFITDPTHVRMVTPNGLKLFSQAFNLECAEKHYSDSPLGLYMDVDFELGNVEYLLDEPWASMRRSGEKTDDDMRQIMRDFNNVIKQTSIGLKVIKPATSVRRAEAVQEPATVG